MKVSFGQNPWIMVIIWYEKGVLKPGRETKKRKMKHFEQRLKIVKIQQLL